MDATQTNADRIHGEASPVCAVLFDEWDALRDPPGGRLELIEGETVLSASPRPAHQVVARSLADRLDEQCPPDLMAVMDIEWRRLAEQGHFITSALRPDVTVTRRSELRGKPAITAAPILAVEVRSPSNTRPTMARKREVYLRNGLGCYVEVGIDAAEAEVSISWWLAAGGRWERAAEAIGDEELAVAAPFPFRVVPNGLLPW